MAGSNVNFAGKAPITDSTLLTSLFGIDKNSLTGPVSLGVLKTALGGGGGGSATLLLTSNPTAATDSTAGAVVGGLALNKTTRRMFYCADNTAGAAVWIPFGRHPGYAAAGGAYYLEGLKINGSNPAVVTPSTASRIQFVYGYNPERVTLANFLLKVTTAVSGSLAQVAIYRVDPVTKRPLGAPVAYTADIDCSSVGIKVAPPVGSTAVVLDPGVYLVAFVPNMAAGSAFTALDLADGTASQSTGVSNSDAFGTLAGLIYAGTYGTWPNFASGATGITTGYGAVPAMPFALTAPPAAT